MKRHLKIISFLTLMAAACTRGDYTAMPLASATISTYPYNQTGLILSSRGGGNYSTGSGAVVRHPRIVISCAHVTYEQKFIDPWVKDNSLHLRHHNGNLPDPRSGLVLPGYISFAGYSQSAALIGMNVPETFHYDFVAYYAYEDVNGGASGGWWDDGVEVLLSDKHKLITGYPGGLYQRGHSDQYKMHATGPYNLAYEAVTTRYLQLNDVAAGPGNSGGPVWVWDGSDWFFAGVHVSGLVKSLGQGLNTAGVVGVEPETWKLVEEAIGNTGQPLGSRPQFTQQPEPVTVSVGTTAVFTARVSANPTPSLRWQASLDGINWEDLFDQGFLTGTGTDTLRVAKTTMQVNGFLLRLRAVNAAGAVFSQAARLTVQATEMPDPGTPKAMPDLAVPKILASPDPIREGSILTLTVTVVNSGDGPAPATKARAFLSPKYDWDTQDDMAFGAMVDIPPLDPGMEFVVRFSGPMPSLGSGTYSYWPVIEVDAGNAVAEEDEENLWNTNEPFTAQDAVNATGSDKLMPLGFNSATGFSLRLQGQPGARYEIQASADLKTWTAVTNVTLTVESQTLTDPDSVRSPHRFYRVKRTQN